VGEGWQVDWSPDGRSILFTSHRDHANNYTDVYVMRPDGSGVRRLTHIRAYTAAWSPDGDHIVFSAPGLFIMDRRRRRESAPHTASRRDLAARLDGLSRAPAPPRNPRHGFRLSARCSPPLAEEVGLPAVARTGSQLQMKTVTPGGRLPL